MARIQAKARVRFSINDFAIHRRAIGVDIEDREKYSDSLLACVEHFGLFDLDNVGDCTVGGGDDSIRIIGRNARRVSEEPERVSNEQKNRQ